MWVYTYILLGAGGIFCYSSGQNVSDIASVGSVPWYGVASVVLCIRYYQGFLYRISYILLLHYWFVHVSKGGYLQSTQYSHIFLELARSRFAQYGETDLQGRHWTINIASFLIYTAVNDLADFCIPDRIWSRIIFNTFLELIVFGHYVYLLFLQRLITRIIRWNQLLFKWRDYSLEYLWSAAIHRFDHQATRCFIYGVLWICHWIYDCITPNVLSGFSSNLLVSKFAYWMFYGLQGDFPLADNVILYSSIYLLCVREFFRFSHPNPGTYQYKKLQKPDHIRLILLHPRFGFRPISCSIMDGPYMRMVFYEAISYTWGNPDRTEEIMVNGCRMKVTKSVYEVLATLSSQFLPQLLWIDAICIDQENSEEKDQQVPIMDKIYSNALITTVFLGQAPLSHSKPSQKGSTVPFKFDGICPPNEQTQKHFETARLTIDTFNEFNILKEHLRSSGKLMYELYDIFLSDATKSLQWQALVTFLQHPWFARVWVVQEVALSPHVQVRYGDETIDWRIMASAMKMIHDLRHFRLWLEWSHQVQIRHTEHSSLYNILRMHKLRNFSFTEEVTITQVLAESSYFKATNPRDQVYGLMSLCREKESLKVDYQASVESVYIAAATELIRKGSLGLLFGLAGIENRPDLKAEARELPSWVPDWTNAPKYEPIRHPDEQSFDYRWNLRMGKTQQPKPAVALVKDNTLLMTGIFVDTIAEIGPSIFNTDITASEGVVEEMHRLWKNCNECRTFLTNSIHTSDPYPYAENQSLLEAFHHSLVTGYKVDLAAWMRELEHFRSMPATNSSDDRDQIYDVLQSMDATTQKVESYCGGRRIFVGADGWIGLCPPGAQKRDRIFCVKGAKVPVMVRKIQGGFEKGFELVGECYCHMLVAEGLNLLEVEIEVI